MVAATGVLVAAVFYILNLRISQRNQELTLKALEQSAKAQQMTLDTRQAQLLMQIFNMINNKEFKNDFSEIIWGWKFDNYEDNIQKYGLHADKVGQATHVWSTYDGVGLLLENKLIDPKMIYGMLEGIIYHTFSQMGSIVGADASYGAVSPRVRAR